IAPLLALELQNEREDRPFLFHRYAGFRTNLYLPLKNHLWTLATEDGSSGKPGRITDHFEPEGYAVVCTCGPEAMMKVVADKCAGAGVPCLVSLERRMACGVGACLGCTVETASGNRRCCADGPIFPAEEMYPDERT
ncbi:MAG: dihydroorotate dehydrogenase electron transfer subunit, partial [Treponema sp.]|nr:dihydroorotate dehydrogenase electron transfer subunit [Treponema sp.]